MISSYASAIDNFFIFHGYFLKLVAYLAKITARHAAWTAATP
jgi:hypothetical protein